MEIIKKKISLENFKSRIPALVELVHDNSNEVQTKGAWGNIPKTIKHSIFKKSFSFNEFVALYESLMDAIINSMYYEYDISDDKWIYVDIDWRSIFYSNDYSYVYVNNLPIKGNTGVRYGLTTNYNEQLINDKIPGITTDDYDIPYIINTMINIIGIEIVPPIYVCNECNNSQMGYDIKQCSNCHSDDMSILQETFVPFFIYWVDINKTIDLLEDLKIHEKKCCDNDAYKKHGGDVFLNYLYEIKTKSTTRWDDVLKRWNLYTNSGDTPTIDIHILLTGKMIDMGIYKTYDVDIIDEDNINNTNTVLQEQINNVVKTNGESKIMTLKRRKSSIDDNANELPGILNKKDNKLYLEFPYKVGYIKNIKNVGDEIYGDTIYSIKQILNVDEITNEQFNSFYGIDINKEYCITGDTKTTIQGISSNVSSVINYTNEDIKLDENINNSNSDTLEKILLLKTELVEYVKNKSDNDIMMAQQKYRYTYNISYKDESGTSKIYVLKNEGSVSVGVIDSEIEFIYVLGGKLIKKNGAIVLDEIVESNPFDSTNQWNGYGIWYKETFPLKKLCTDKFIINGKEELITYDYIDFKSKEITYSFDGIDFPRKKYILCDEIIYRANAYEKYATNDTVYKDEKMTGINFPLKEKYDIVIDRGSVAAYERHIQLSDIKTWEDLENYRNGELLK